MPSLANLMNLALGYGTKAEDRSGPRYRRPTCTISYGEHPLHALDFHSAGEGTRPLVAFLHGGGWQFGDKTRRTKDLKTPFCHAEGWHFASLNFRLVPEVGVAEMARDAAAAVAALFARAEELGVDRERIVLMGHSSGAHLAALVATDPALLGAHGLEPRQLAGVIANDGAAYDPREPSTASAFWRRRLIDPAFTGADLAALSPVRHAQAGGQCPPFLVLHASSAPITDQAERLEAALRAAGGAVRRSAFPGHGIVNHMRLSRRFGEAGFGPTEVARTWLRERFASPPPGKEFSPKA